MIKDFRSCRRFGVLGLLPAVLLFAAAAGAGSRFVGALFSEPAAKITVYTIAGNSYGFPFLKEELRIALQSANMGNTVSDLPAVYRQRFVSQFVSRRMEHDLLIHDAMKKNLFADQEMQALLRIYTRQAVLQYYRMKSGAGYRPSTNEIEAFYNTHRERLVRYPYKEVISMISRQLVLQHRETALSNSIQKMAAGYRLQPATNRLLSAFTNAGSGAPQGKSGGDKN